MSKVRDFDTERNVFSRSPRRKEASERVSSMLGSVRGGLDSARRVGISNDRIMDLVLWKSRLSRVEEIMHQSGLIFKSQEDAEEVREMRRIINAYLGSLSGHSAAAFGSSTESRNSGDAISRSIQQGDRQ